MSDDSKELSRVEDILSGEDYLPKKPMSRVEELLMDGAMVPKVDDTDNGKVLKVIDGEWQPGEDVSGDNLPPVSSLDNGKVLKVVSGEWNIGDDKSESSYVYISSTYPFSGSKVALPANINSVLIANYTSSPKVPTFLVTSNNIIFEPKEVDISSGTTPSVHIRWGRMYSTFDSATREQDIYNDSLSYNTQNQTTEASYFKTKAIQTIPPVDTPDYGKVMQVGNGGTWQANYLPEVDGVPQVTSSDVGKVLKATDANTYGWGDAPDPLPEVDSSDNGKILKVVEGAWAAGADEGGSEAVYKTLEEYQALTQAQKEDPTKIYFVINEGSKVSPTLDADDGNISVSSYQSAYVPWHAFDGSTRSDIGTNSYCWAPWGQNGGEWIAYSFSSQQQFSKVRFRSCQESTYQDVTFKYYVEGSNDGTTWNNLLLNKEYESIVMPKANATASITFNFVDFTFLLDTTLPTYSKIRVRVDQSISYPYSSNRWSVANFDIYAANTSAIPMIYYKDVLYNPLVKELPDTLVADAGKALVVNSEGEWDKGNIPRTNSVQVPPVIFDNGKLKKMSSIDNFPGIEQIFLTPTAYSNLTIAEKEDLSKIYYVSDYEFITNDDKTLVLRIDGSNNVLLFFNGVVTTNSTPLTMPSEIAAYISNYPDSYGYYDPSDTSSVDCYINCNWSGDNSKYWSQSGRHNGTVINDIPVYGVMNPSGAYGQELVYTNPWDIEGGFTIYYGGKQYTEYTAPSVYRELTQAEYDALPSSKNSDGIIYFITDNS